MLYLALPPIPTPIVSTLTPQVASQNNACESLKPKSQKSDLVNNLLGKILANSVSIKPCDTDEKKSAITQTDIQETEPTLYSTSVAPAATPAQDLPTTDRVDKGNTASPTLVEEAKVIEAQEAEIQTKSAEKNPIGQILATVQQLINVSLYASINNTISDTVESKPQNPSQIASKVPNSENKTEDNANDRKVASNTNINSVKILAVVQELIAASVSASLNNTINDSFKAGIEKSGEIALDNPAKDKKENISDKLRNNKKKIAANNNKKNSLRNSLIDKLRGKNDLKLAQVPGEPFLVGIMINGREVGTLDIIEENNTLLIPLETLGEVSGFTVKRTKNGIDAKTPLGVVNFAPDVIKQINGQSYVSKEILEQKLDISVELNTADLTLLADLPWRGGSRQTRTTAELKPEFLAPGTGLSSLRQELNITTRSGDTKLRTSTLLGGRLAGGTWRMRLNNNFENEPNLTEYFFYKRSNQFRYQIGRQRIGLHPLVNGLELTGLQFGYSNLPTKSFSSSSGASEILPRRSRPVQTFRGQVPPASVVQLRVGGVAVAQQQVGFNGVYEFLDVRLPVGQSNEVEVLVFDRNNLRSPIDIRTERISSSDLLLPPGGNVQIGGLGFSGNLVQDSLFSDNDSDDDGELVGFYQMRQGLSKNLTFESSLQAVPSSFQGQAGLVWRLANPVILSASVGNSFDKVGYSANLDVELQNLEINANSQSLPRGYRTGRDTSPERSNHSLELKYRFGNKLNMGFIARSRETLNQSDSYILPTFSARPFSNLSLNGRPDIYGKYLFNAFFRPSRNTRLSLNTFGDSYNTDLRYNLSRNYQLFLGSEFGGDRDSRYSLGFGHNASSLDNLSWNVGLAVSDGNVGPSAGASMRVLPGLFARLNYQAIPSRGGSFSAINDGRLSLSLTSDMSVAGGRFTPARYSGISKERGAISGKLAVKGESKGFDLSNSIVRVYDTRNKNVGSVKTDDKGNFFLGNLPEGVYVLELEPEELPIELAVSKTSLVAEVAPSGVTRVDFPVRTEYGVAGKVTDASGQPLKEVSIELVTSTGARVLSG
ncbi:MAG: Cna B-type, partial [Rivularia sp. (in: cyanobacteria)]